MRAVYVSDLLGEAGEVCIGSYQLVYMSPEAIISGEHAIKSYIPGEFGRASSV